MPHRSSDSVKGERLRALRLAKHLDVVVLARKVNLSSAQLRQLESGEHSLFYSSAIRLHAIRKVFAELGEKVEVPEAPLEIQNPPAQEVPATSPKDDGSSALSLNLNRPNFFSKIWKLLFLAGLCWMSMLWWFNRVQSLDDSMAQSISAPVPIAVVPEPIIAAAQVMQAPAPVIPPESKPLQQPKTLASCTWKASDDAAVVISPQWPTKKGDMVYLQAQSDARICVMDGTGQSWQTLLQADQGRSFYGAAPWRVFSPDLQNTVIYFQGQRIRFDAQSLVLNEAPGPF